jgi:hypothetical protein
VQTVGTARASAGYHRPDGEYAGEAYCAAVDLRTRDLNRTRIKVLLKHLAEAGFAAWYRFEGAFTNNNHIHAVFVAVPMKDALQRQVWDFIHDRNGLAEHGREHFYTAPASTDAVIRAMFLDANASLSSIWQHASQKQVAA